MIGYTLMSNQLKAAKPQGLKKGVVPDSLLRVWWILGPVGETFSSGNWRT